jgi:hypothetical protein
MIWLTESGLYINIVSVARSNGFAVVALRRNGYVISMAQQQEAASISLPNPYAVHAAYEVVSFFTDSDI